MSGPTTLSELLRENLKQLKAPAGYEEFKNRLSATKQTRRPPTIKVKSGEQQSQVWQTGRRTGLVIR